MKDVTADVMTLATAPNESPKTFTIGEATLVLGDAKTLAERYMGMADLILSDPPYKLTSGGKPKDGVPAFRGMSGIFSGDVYNNSGLLMDVPTWGEIAGVIRTLASPNAEAYVMANDKNIFPAQTALAAQGWKLHNLLVWDKEHPTPNRWYMKHLEFVLYMWVGKARAINNKGSKQRMTAKREPGEDKIHETQKPLCLMTHYILNSTQPGDVVIDPYVGSGATIIAAAACGRRAIGFEVDPVRFEKAVLNMQRHLEPVK